MGKIKTLKSVSYGLNDHFLSLYNRINGYWALGVLYKEALRTGSQAITFDLLNKSVYPQNINAKETLEYSQKYLFRLLDSHHLDISKIKKVFIVIKFDRKPTNLDLNLRPMFGNPLICKTILVDIKGNLYSFKKRDRCKEYDKGNFIHNI